MNMIIEPNGTGRLISYGRNSAAPKGPQYAERHCDDNSASRGPLMKRPGLTAALDSVGRGDTLVVRSVDRLTRDAGQIGLMIAYIKAKGAGFATLEGPATLLPAHSDLLTVHERLERLRAKQQRLADAAPFKVEYWSRGYLKIIRECKTESEALLHALSQAFDGVTVRVYYIDEDGSRTDIAHYPADTPPETATEES